MTPDVVRAARDAQAPPAEPEAPHRPSKWPDAIGFAVMVVSLAAWWWFA